MCLVCLIVFVSSVYKYMSTWYFQRANPIRISSCTCTRKSTVVLCEKVNMALHLTAFWITQDIIYRAIPRIICVSESKYTNLPKRLIFHAKVLHHQKNIWMINDKRRHCSVTISYKTAMDHRFCIILYQRLWRYERPSVLGFVMFYDIYTYTGVVYFMWNDE